jgi:hypothetical protein
MVEEVGKNRSEDVEDVAKDKTRDGRRGTRR